MGWGNIEIHKNFSRQGFFLKKKKKREKRERVRERDQPRLAIIIKLNFVESDIILICNCWDKSSLTESMFSMQTFPIARRGRSLLGWESQSTSQCKAEQQIVSETERGAFYQGLWAGERTAAFCKLTLKGHQKIILQLFIEQDFFLFQ